MLGKNQSVLVRLRLTLLSAGPLRLPAFAPSAAIQAFTPHSTNSPKRTSLFLTLSWQLWVPLSHRLMLSHTLPLLSRNLSSNFLWFSREIIGLGSALTSLLPSTQTSSFLFAIPQIAWPALLGRQSPLSDRASSSTLGRLFSRFSGPCLLLIDSSSVILHHKFTIHSTSL